MTVVWLVLAALAAQAEEPIALRYEPTGRVWNDVRGLCFSPDSRWLAAGLDDRIVVWDVSARKMAVNLPIPRLSCGGLTFSPDGRMLVAGLHTGVVRIWDGSQGWARAKETEPIEAPVINRPKRRNLQEEREPVAQVAFSANGKILLWSSRTPAGNDNIHLWRWPAREEMAVFQVGPVLGDGRFQLNGNELAIVVGSVRRRPGGAEIEVWDTAAKERIHRIPAPAGPIGGVRFSPDGNRLAGTIAPEHGRPASAEELVVWDIATGKSVSFGRGPHQWLSVPAFSPDGSRLAVGTFSNPVPPCPSAILLLDVANGRRQGVLRSRRAGTAPRELAFSPDGRYLAAGMDFDDVPVYLWSMPSSRAAATAPRSPGSAP